MAGNRISRTTLGTARETDSLGNSSSKGSDRTIPTRFRATPALQFFAIGQPAGHSGRSLQRTVSSHIIIVENLQRHAHFVVFPLFRESICQSRITTIECANVEIYPLAMES